jgi:hypothetical protein
MMRRKHWVIAAAIPLLLAAADVVYWRFAAERLRTGFQTWVTVQTARGWECGSAAVSIGGWPRAASVTVPNLKLRHTGTTVPGDVDLAATGITLSVSLLNPTILRLSLAGPLHVRVGAVPEMVVTGEEASVSVPLRQTGPLYLNLHASGLRLEPATGVWQTTVGLLNAEAELAADAGTDPSEPAATFVVTSEAIALPAGIKWPLGPNVSSLSAEGALNGPLPETRDIKAWAEAWRDGGGSLEVKHLAVGWGPLGLTSTATLALDEQLQPMGSGSGRVVGYAESLDRLAAGGKLTKSAATAAKAVLSLMAGTTDADERSSVDVPLTLQYRTLSMRQVPLVRLPELDWPAR